MTRRFPTFVIKSYCLSWKYIVWCSRVKLKSDPFALYQHWCMQTPWRGCRYWLDIINQFYDCLQLLLWIWLIDLVHHLVYVWEHWCPAHCLEMVHFSTMGAFLPIGRTSFFLRTCFVPQYRHLTQLCMTDWGLPFLPTFPSRFHCMYFRLLFTIKNPSISLAQFCCSAGLDTLIQSMCCFSREPFSHGVFLNTTNDSIAYPKYVLFLSGAFLSWRFPEYHKWFDRWWESL